MTQLEQLMAIALEEAVELITSEYCSHSDYSGHCSATARGCYATKQIAALDAYREQQERERVKVHY